MQTPETITITSETEWAEFAEANAEALAEDFGSVERARLKAQHSGGLMLGGGAAPLFNARLRLPIKTLTMLVYVDPTWTRPDGEPYLVTRQDGSDYATPHFMDEARTDRGAAPFLGASEGHAYVTRFVVADNVPGDIAAIFHQHNGAAFAPMAAE